MTLSSKDFLEIRGLAAKVARALSGLVNDRIFLELTMIRGCTTRSAGEVAFDAGFAGMAWQWIQKNSSLTSISSTRPRIVDANVAKSSKQLLTA